MKKGSTVIVIFAWAVWFGWGSFVGAEEAFYQGKTVTFIVGFSAGGGFDAYSRAIARHIGKHIPGNPNVVVDNKPGAGSLIAANYIYNKAKPDGLTIGNWIGSLVLQQVMGNKAAQFDSGKFGWLGAPVPDHTVCALSTKSGVTNMDEWLAAKRPMKLGGTGPGSNTVDPPKLLKEVLNLPMQIIEGYGGTSKVLLAMEAGELDGGCWSWQAMKSMLQNQLKDGTAHVVLQIAAAPHPDLKTVPVVLSYAKTKEAQELLRIGALDLSRIMRPYSLPPGTPKERLAVLQKAFRDTLQDPEFLAEAEKAKLEVDPVNGLEIEEIADRIAQSSPATIAKLSEMLLVKKGK